MGGHSHRGAGVGAAAASSCCRALLRLLVVALLALVRNAAAQLPNLRVGLPEDVDANKRLDMQAGYGLKVGAKRG
jgi:hypothetical protein